MTDILERLNLWRETSHEGDPMIDALLHDMHDAADEIARLQAALVSLTATLDGCLDAFPGDTADAWGGGNLDDIHDRLEQAREALKGTTP